MLALQQLSKKYEDDPKVVNIFGIILYTDEHPNIKKILRDDDYWDALHEISGEHLAIFSVKPKKGKYKSPDAPEGSFCFMESIWEEPSDNKKLLAKLSIESTKDLPLLLIFTHFENEIWQKQIPLDHNSFEESFSSLKDSISLVSNSIKNIYDKKNSKEASIVAHAAIRKHNGLKMIKKGINFYSWLKDLLP